MKNKLLYLLGLIVIVLAAIILYFLVFRKPVPIVTNVNQPTPGIEQIVNDPIAYTEEIKKQNIPYWQYYSILEFQTFCDVKNNAAALTTGCADVMGSYLVEENSSTCVNDLGFLAMIYFLKANDQEGFLRVCNDYKISKPKITDCNQLWADKLYENNYFCDENNLCPVLFDGSSYTINTSYDPQADKTVIVPSENIVCQNKISLQTVDLGKLSSPSCKKIFPLRKAASISDCNAIEDDLAKLICLEQISGSTCTDFKAYRDNLKMPDFITKYQIKNCCFEGDASENEKGTY